MKRLVLLLAALLVAGCGEKSSSEGSESASKNPTPSHEIVEISADTAQPVDNNLALPLSDADVERLVRKAVNHELIRSRNGLLYGPDAYPIPFSGWIKEIIPSGQVKILLQAKGGMPEGLYTSWHENGQKETEGFFKDGEPDGLCKAWHASGQKRSEGTFRDGEEASVKYWNSKGEAVETYEEAKK